MSYTIRPATRTDAKIIGRHLREADRIELEASSGDAEQAVLDSFEHSDECYVAEADGHPFCIFGVGGVAVAGVPWMVGTDQLNRYGKSLVRQGGLYVDLWLEKYGKLFNFVHAGNTTSILWLKHLGFTVQQSITQKGPQRAPFHLFYMSLPDV